MMRIQERRKKLLKRNPGTAFVLAAAPERVRNKSTLYPYRQDSDFYYLTGIEEPQAVLVLREAGSALFIRSRDPEHERWEGAMLGLEGARKLARVDEVFDIADLDRKLPELLSDVDSVHYRLGRDGGPGGLDFRLLKALEARKRGRTGLGLPAIHDSTTAIGEIRLFKDSDELTLLRAGAAGSARAHVEAMKAARPGMTESELVTILERGFRENGAERLAYGSIVAAGANALCLHYKLCRSKLREGELVLIDAGGEYGFYATDITRTFPAGRRFSSRQVEAYEVVLEAQAAALSQAKPGSTLERVDQAARKVLERFARKLKMDSRELYPHLTSHWLGLDVHDSGLYRDRNGKPRVLEPGMCFTVEPGAYFRRGGEAIGIRIEDDVLITARGHEVLTAGVPKERAEIEALRSLA